MLSEQQQKFVEEYLIDLNATSAAKRAGYSEKTARAKGSNLLTNVNIREAIEAKKKERAASTKITSDRVLIEIGKIALSDIRHFYDDNGFLLPPKLWPDEVAGAVASVEVLETDVGRVTKLKLWDKGRQIELAAKHLGMLNEDKNKDAEKVDPVQVVFEVVNASA